MWSAAPGSDGSDTAKKNMSVFFLTGDCRASMLWSHVFDEVLTFWGNYLSSMESCLVSHTAGCLFNTVKRLELHIDTF